jgi:hypothetical protein
MHTTVRGVADSLKSYHSTTERQNILQTLASFPFKEDLSVISLTAKSSLNNTFKSAAKKFDHQT